MIALLAAALPLTASASGGAAPSLTAGSSPDPLGLRELLLWRELNRERAEHDLPPLQLDFMVSAVAQQRSDDMVALDYFGHVSPRGESAFTLLAARGARIQAGAETLAQARGGAFDSTGFAVRALMASPPHRAAILDPRMTHVGVGSAVSPGGLWIFTAIYIR